jgi:hypothetical protein
MKPYATDPEAILGCEPKRQADTGLVRPYRPAPADFREVYLRMGWGGIADHYRTNWRVIRRWIEECGGNELREERARVSGRPTAPHRRSGKAGRYVLGLTLTAVQSRKSEE